MNMFLKTGELQPDTSCTSSILQLGDFFYLSGQYGEGQTFYDQCIQVCYRIQEVLHEFDLRFDHVLSFTVYLTDISLRQEFLGVFSNFVEAPFPVMTVVEVAALPNHSMICIQANGVNTLRYERNMNEAYCDDCD